MATTSRCVACGADLSGQYCSACGELAGHHDYSLKHFAEEALEAFGHVDGRVFSSFLSLVTRPGLLAANFLAGRRRWQIGPLQLFVTCNLIYFLMQPITAFAPFTSTLDMQTTERPWSAMATRMVTARVQARHTTIDAYAHRFDETAHFQGKSLVILMVPMFALGTWALYGKWRRFYAEHIVIAFYILAFLMLWMGVSTLALTEPVMYGVRHKWSDDFIETTTGILIAAPFAIYLFLAGRRISPEAAWRITVKTLFLTGWAMAVLTAYRFVLFFTSFYAT